jgi:hypothetical protein
MHTFLAGWGDKVSENWLFCPLFTSKNDQDRLGTNIGKALEKRDRFLAKVAATTTSWPWPYVPAASDNTTLRW